MQRSDYMKDFYKQFEELNKKLDKANSTITMLSINNKLLIDEIKDLKKEINKLQ